MKKVVMLALCVLGLVLISGFTLLETQPHPVFLNGKPFGNAVVVQGGIIAISVQDFAKAGGASLTLEPNFKLQGNMLLAVAAPAAAQTQGKQETTGQKVIGGTSVPAVQQGALVPAVKKADTSLPAVQYPKVEIKAAVKYAPGQLFRVQNAGPISTQVMMINGKAYIPLADVAKAFGGVLSYQTGGSAGLKPGEAIRLNFAANPRGILIGL